jgi:hypothetical protein
MRTCHIVTLFVYIAYLVIIKHLPILRCRPVMRDTQVYIQQVLPFIMLLYSNDTVINVSDGDCICITVYVIPKQQGMYD